LWILRRIEKKLKKRQYEIVNESALIAKVTKREYGELAFSFGV
jgi:hypothetical protein